MDAFEEGRFSPHAAQLQRGFPWLRFAPELEEEFREYHVRRQRVQIRIALAAGAALFLLFALRDYHSLPPEVWHWTVGLRVWVIVPALALMLAVSYAPIAGRWIERIGAVIVVVVMGATGASVLVSESMGAALPYEALLVVMVYAIFLTGLRFYHATMTTCGVAAAYLATHVALELPSDAFKQGLYLYVIALIGLLGGYMLEWTRRANFLTRRIMQFRAEHDPLTYLYNRRAAVDHLQRTWRLAAREGRPLAVLLLDVDHFKKFNDHYGHLAGDGCLSEVAMALHHRLRRPMDLVARYGGEEFLAVLYGVAGDNVQRVAEAVREIIEGLTIPHAHNPPGIVTVSVGASWAEPTDPLASAELLLETADQALYRAKKAGRNRVEARGVAPSVPAEALKVPQ